MNAIPPFHPHSEALMSNLASRSHEWRDWEIEELLLELPFSPHSRGKRKEHFRILLKVQWHQLGMHQYILTKKSSPTEVLVARIPHDRQALSTARILARKHKDSHGAYTSISAEKIDTFLTIVT